MRTGLGAKQVTSLCANHSAGFWPHDQVTLIAGLACTARTRSPKRAEAPGEITLIDKRDRVKGQTVVNRYKVKSGEMDLRLHPRPPDHRRGPEYVSAELVAERK